MTRKQQQFNLFRIRHFQDESAFRSLVDEYGPRIERYLRARLPNFTEADDAYSETWMKLWNYTQSTKIDSFIAVALTIARNVVADYYRTKDKRAEVLVEYEMKEVHSVELHKDMIHQVDANILLEIIQEFKEEHAQIMHLRYVEGFSVKDIAKQIGKTENATSIIIHRSIKRVREIISKKFGQL